MNRRKWGGGPVICLLLVMFLLLSGILALIYKNSDDKSITPLASHSYTISGNDGIDGLLSHHDYNINYMIASNNLKLVEVTDRSGTIGETNTLKADIKFQRFNGSSWNTFGTGGTNPFRISTTTFTEIDADWWTDVCCGGILWNPNLSPANWRIIVTFPGAALSYKGERLDVTMTLSNFSMSTLGPTEDVIILRQNCERIDLCSRGVRNQCQSRVAYDVDVSISGANDEQGVFLSFSDLDQQGMDNSGHRDWLDNNYTEGVEIISGVISTPIMPRNRLLSVYEHDGNYVFRAIQGTDGADSYRAAVSYLGTASGTKFRWYGVNCGTELGINVNEYGKLNVKTKINLEAYNSPVSPTSDDPRKYIEYTVDSEDFLSAMAIAYSYTYTRANLLMDVWKNGYSGGADMDTCASIFVYPAAGSTVGGGYITSDKTYTITINRYRYSYHFISNLPSGASESDLSGMPYSKNAPGNFSPTYKKVVASTNTLAKSDATVASPSLTGYRFKGWNTKADGTGDPYPGAELMLSNKNFYAQWERLAYTVKFNDNRSSNPNHQTGEQPQNNVSGTMNDQEMEFDKTAALNENKFTREGYTFKGWNTKADGTGTSYTDKQSVTNLVSAGESEITLYAQWTKNLGTETITVKDELTSNGVSGVKLQFSKQVNGSYEGITAPTTGTDGKITTENLHWFKYKWSCQSVPTGYRIPSSEPTFDITYNNLTHTTEMILYRIRYKVRYDANGSSNPDHQTGESTQNITTGSMADSEYTYNVKGTLRTNDFKRSGYVFNGWNTKADGTGISYPDGYDSVLNWSSTDGEVITLYAQWKKKLGTETIAIISEETGNPVRNVTMRLEKYNGNSYEEITTQTTDADGRIIVNDLHWFSYRWVMTNVPAGYAKSSDTTFTIGYNALSHTDDVILYMKHVGIIVDSQVNGVIKGENAPAFMYHISGTDVAGVLHEYNILVQTNENSGYGTNSINNIFAGTYNITQMPVSRYRPGIAQNISHATVNGINASVDVKNYNLAEIKFPYTIKEYGWYYGVNSKVNHLIR